jgi:hypothetical protein
LWINDEPQPPGELNRVVSQDHELKTAVRCSQNPSEIAALAATAVNLPWLVEPTRPLTSMEKTCIARVFAALRDRIVRNGRIGLAFTSSGAVIMTCVPEGHDVVASCSAISTFSQLLLSYSARYLMENGWCWSIRWHTLRSAGGSVLLVEMRKRV